MIVDDLNVPGFAIPLHKTDPPLIVNANAALTLAVAVQRLQTIAGRHTQIVKLLCRVDRKQLRAGAPLNLRRQIADGVAGKDRSRTFIAKAFDHGQTVTRSGTACQC
jgi:hypothetical protein